MKLELDEKELALFIRLIEESTFAGKIARFVADLLEKLQTAAKEERE